ncbi:hypothetical protein QQ045_021414 [Rhodiola kirilowii]
MERLMLKPVSCSFKEVDNFRPHISFLSLYSKHRNTHLNLPAYQNQKFILLSPRVTPDGKDYLVLQRIHGEVVYELTTQNSSEGDKNDQVCDDDQVENVLRWRFISRVYAVLAAQLTFCAVVSTVICLLAPVKSLGKIHPAIAFFVALLPFILSWPLAVYRKQYPSNIILLGIITACTSIDIAICCAAMKGKIVLEALLLTMAGVLFLTGYTFWASKKGKSFSYLRPFLSSCLAILLVTGVLQLFFPLVSKGNAIYAAVVAMVFSGYLVHDTDSMIRHYYKYNEYIAASVSIFLDIVIFFLSNLDMLQYCNELFS